MYGRDVEEKMQAAAQQNRATYPQGAALAGSGNYLGNSLCDAPCPVDPGMRQKCQETIGYLFEAHENVGFIQSQLFMNDRLKGNGNVGKESTQPSIDELLKQICQMAASLVGETSGIKNRL